MVSTEELYHRFSEIRNFSEEICKPLEIEDYVIQISEEVSPAKWNLAHTTWFFDQFILQRFSKNKPSIPKEYYFLFNSYYQTVGRPFQRLKRGTLSRPTVKEVFHYRKQINECILDLIQSCDEDDRNEIFSLVELGLQHEQQHQELMITDLKFNFFANPCSPVIKDSFLNVKPTVFNGTKKNLLIQEGVYELGCESEEFHFDNETPKHRVYLPEIEIENRMVTNSEYLEFIEDGGYSTCELWLSDGWDWIQENEISAPLYWMKEAKDWVVFDFDGIKELNHKLPVSHISFYEASAFANWKNKDIPTEVEWEVCCGKSSSDNENPNLLFRDKHTNYKNSTSIFIGDLWQWTSSPYVAYPGFKPLDGSLGEYNGKFMSNQMVLRGGSCATPFDHIRNTYRNFFQSDKRWQFSGLRLAKRG